MQNRATGAPAARRPEEFTLNFEFASMEWVWTEHSIRVNLPDGQERLCSGTYGEVLAVQNDLGKQGWDVATSVASSNWIYWTFRRFR